MTQVCVECKKEYGEKCGKCGARTLLIDEPGFKCLSCGNRWRKGDEPVTHGICATCQTVSNKRQ